MTYGTTYLNGVKVENSVNDKIFSLDTIDKNNPVEIKSFELILCKPNEEEISILNCAYDVSLSTSLNDIDEIEFTIPYYGKEQYAQVKNPNWDLIKDDYLLKYNNEKIFVINDIVEKGEGKTAVKTVHCYSREYQLTTRILTSFKGTRQLYRTEEDGAVLKVDYSLDGSSWIENIDNVPFIIDEGKTVYIKLYDLNGKVINSCEWNSNDTVSHTKGINVTYKVKDIIDKKIEVTIKIIAENGEGILNNLEKETSWRVGYIDPKVRDEDTQGQNHRRYRTFDVSNKSWIQVIKEDICKAFHSMAVFDTLKKEVSFIHEDSIGRNTGFYISEKNYIKSIKKHTKDDEIVTRLRVFGKENLSISNVNPTGELYIENFDYYKNLEYMPKDLIDALDTYEKKCEEATGIFEELLIELGNLRAEELVLNNELVDLKRELSLAQDDIDLAIQKASKDIDNREDVNQKTDLSSLNSIRDEKQELVNSKQKEIENKKEEIEAKLREISTLKDDLKKGSNFTKEQLLLLDTFIKEKTWSNGNYTDGKELIIAGRRALSKMSKPIIEFDLDIVDFLNILECQNDWNKLSLGDSIFIHYDKFDLDIEVKLVGIQHSIDANSLRIIISNKDQVDSSAKYISDLIRSSSEAKNKIDMFGHKWDLADTNLDLVSKMINSALDTSKNRVLSGRNQNIDISERGISLKDMLSNEEQLRMLNNVIAFTKDGWDSCSLAISPDGIVAESLFGKIVATNKLLITNMNNEGESSFTVDENHMIAENMDLSLENGKNRIYLNPSEGIKIQKSKGSQWGDVLWLDTEGTLHTENLVASNLEIRNSEGDILLDSEENFLNIGRFDRITDDGKLTPIEKISLRKEWLRIQVEYPKLIIQGNKYNSSDRDSKELIDLLPYTQAYSALDQYISPLLRYMDKPSELQRDVFDLKFNNYYEQAKEIRNRIDDALKYSSVQLGRVYNNTLIDAINGITITKVHESTKEEIAVTTLNATTGISIATKKNGVWEDNFWVDSEGNLIAQNLLILDENGRPAFQVDKQGELDLEGRLKVIRYETDKIDSPKIIMADLYKDEKLGGKLLINDWEGMKNVFLGSSPNKNYNGGFLEMYNSQENKKIEFGTYATEDAGRINLFGHDDNINISLSAIDDSGQSAGVVKLYNTLNEACIFLSAETDQNTMSRENTQIVIGQEIQGELKPKVGLYGGQSSFGGFLELSDKHGVPNLSMGDISENGDLKGSHIVLYANMADSLKERHEKRRIQIGVFGSQGEEGSILLFNSIGECVGSINTNNGDLNITNNNNTSVIMKQSGEIDLKGVNININATGTVNVSGDRINLN